MHGVRSGPSPAAPTESRTGEEAGNLEGNGDSRSPPQSHPRPARGVPRYARIVPSRSANDCRARLIRERTVPIGIESASAISW